MFDIIPHRSDFRVYISILTPPNINYSVIKYLSHNSNKILNAQLVITSYTMIQKLDFFSLYEWGGIILDEAQAIKNFETVQAIKIKKIKGDYRIAMTGTPIENNLLNLWSIFDFLNPGMLGTRDEFKGKIIINNDDDENRKRLEPVISPFILRRLKTDKKIINELPEKQEIVVYLDLTDEQKELYNGIIYNCKNIEVKSDLVLKSVILKVILNLKQVCNHPAQYLGDNDYSYDRSSKFIELKKICEKIYSNNEKVLIFTQYTEIIKPIQKLLAGVFNNDGEVITGDTSMSKRKKIVDEFQGGKYSFLVLSINSSGQGLNLTNATNVIHFDRWWNPAVEEQATDRAYRIGQHNKVTIYKFICNNTVEELIDKIIKRKKSIADSVLSDLSNDISKKLSIEELKECLNFINEGDGDE